MKFRMFNQTTLADLCSVRPIRNIAFDQAMTGRGWKSTLNMSENDELWGSIAISPGVVALEHSLTDAVSLPRGDAFPWDSDKSVYILDSYHNLHCLVREPLSQGFYRGLSPTCYSNLSPQKALYNYITESERGQEHSMDYWHMVHCLDEVRRGVVCNAGNVRNTGVFIKGAF